MPNPHFQRFSNGWWWSEGISSGLCIECSHYYASWCLLWASINTVNQEAAEEQKRKRAFSELDIVDKESLFCWMASSLHLILRQEIAGSSANFVGLCRALKLVLQAVRVALQASADGSWLLSGISSLISRRSRRMVVKSSSGWPTISTITATLVISVYLFIAGNGIIHTSTESIGPVAALAAKANGGAIIDWEPAEPLVCSKPTDPDPKLGATPWVPL